MDKLDLKRNLNLSNKEFRSQVVELEEKINNLDKEFKIKPADCPLKHLFSEGMYVREVTVPAGTLVIGKIHKHEHPAFLLKGEAWVVTEYDGVQKINGPCSFISPAGIKRAVYAKTELIWTTVHLNPDNKRDLGKIEKEHIAINYEEFDKFITQKNIQQLKQ
jgi:hypothetical protein